eukprot:scaffold12183_cov68-Phaeocystis_antarctica.AAC.11
MILWRASSGHQTLAETAEPGAAAWIGPNQTCVARAPQKELRCQRHIKSTERQTKPRTWTASHAPPSPTR